MSKNYIYPATLLCDFYKVGHREQYPENTEKIYSTWTPRTSRIKGIDKVVSFGFQAFIKEYLINYFNEKFFNRNLDDVVNEYQRVIKYTLSVQNPNASHIISLHKLGYLPLQIKAVKEGTLIPIRIPMLTVENTKSEFFWLTNYIETLMSCYLWQPSTSATLAREYRKILNEYAEKTGGDMSFVQFQGHDFSMRGMGSLESAKSSGAGHLLSFTGTDTIPAILYLEEFYNANIENELVGTSIPALEHSVVCSGGSNDEFSTLKRMLTEVYPNGMFSYVSDSWDLWHVLTNYLPKLKNIIMNRDGKLVVRPDCYDEKTEILTNNGWKLFKDLNKEKDLVAQFDNGNIEFIKPLKYIEKNYNGDMVNFTSVKNKIDLLVTPNHRMLRYNKKLNEYQIKEATIMKYFTDRHLPVSGLKQGEVNILTPYERLMIAFQADGRCRINEDRDVGILGGKYILEFNFAKQRKTDRLKEICEKGNFIYKISEPYSRRFSKKQENWNDQVDFCVYMDKKPLKQFIEWVNFTDKSYLWCREFIEEVSHWDATIRNENRIKFDNTNKSDAEIVQIATILSGYRSTFTVSEDNRSEKFNDINTIHIVKNKRYVEGQAINIDTINYNGKIYCVQVPSGMLVVRRNQQVAISGNSGDPVKIICGDSESSNENERKGVVEILWDIFSGTVTDKGYKVLDSHIGCIYGDAITIERCKEICEQLMKKNLLLQIWFMVLAVLLINTILVILLVSL